MKKLLLIATIILGLDAMLAQTMYVRSLTGSETTYPIANIQKLIFDNDNFIVINETGPNATFSLNNYRFINFTDLLLGSNNAVFEESKFYVYPNPSSQWLNIANSNPTQTPSLVEVISIDGKLLMQQKPSTTDMQLDISVLPQGIYLCKVTSGNQRQTLKFLKQ